MPMRYKRVAEAFDDVARARLCESSGSEHSPENSMDLSDLVKSFLEREEEENCEVDEESEPKQSDQSEGHCDDDSELTETLRGLLGCGDDAVKRIYCYETEKSVRGLCKSKWDRTGRIPSGSFEYIDLNISETRYIIEISLVTQFQIARATKYYTSLLENFPPIFVGKVDELKQVARLMCREIRRLHEARVDMHVPPWRRFAYMQKMWFGSYKRTTNEVPEKRSLVFDEVLAGKRSVGFVPVPVPEASESFQRVHWEVFAADCNFLFLVFLLFSQNINRKYSTMDFRGDGVERYMHLEVVKTSRNMEPNAFVAGEARRRLYNSAIMVEVESWPRRTSLGAEEVVMEDSRVSEKE
ncbi:hypothetical protein Acr_00g0013920 [Actinidia rufa]|uniref:DUF506 family protein n=1 Tax=Actinidia rufa TaxID=165716 RepID=A0A7J0DBJ6_9ERIC|nr:hypothetical protein Acr_00g0013920 [Actinidia rufa]